MATTGAPEARGGATRAYLIGHPDTRTSTVIAVSVTLSGLAWMAVIILSMMTAAHILPSDAAAAEIVGAVIGMAVLLGVAAVVAVAVRAIQRLMSEHHQALYEGVEEVGDQASSYEQAVCDVLMQGRLTAIPRQR